MQQNRTDGPLALAVDPEGSKMDPRNVITIHKMHADGVGWAKIAAEVGTNRKNVGRIVKGLRWAHLHPSRRPDLYADSEHDDETGPMPSAPLVIAGGDPLAPAMRLIYEALKAAA